MTPKQIIHKAMRTKYGQLQLVKTMGIDISYSYHKISDKIACMVTQEEDGFGYRSHMTFAKCDNGICEILPMNMYVSHDIDITFKKLRTIQNMYKGGMDILQVN